MAGRALLGEADERPGEAPAAVGTQRDDVLELRDAAVVVERRVGGVDVLVDGDEAARALVSVNRRPSAATSGP